MDYVMSPSFSPTTLFSLRSNDSRSLQWCSSWWVSKETVIRSNDWKDIDEIIAVGIVFSIILRRWSLPIVVIAACISANWSCFHHRSPRQKCQEATTQGGKTTSTNIMRPPRGGEERWGFHLLFLCCVVVESRQRGAGQIIWRGESFHVANNTYDRQNEVLLFVLSA